MRITTRGIPVVVCAGMACALAGCLGKGDSTKAGGSGPPATLTIGTQVAARYVNGQFVSIPNAAQAGFGWGTCATRIIDTFLKTLKTGRRRCAAREQAVFPGRFSLRRARFVEDVSVTGTPVFGYGPDNPPVRLTVRGKGTAPGFIRLPKHAAFDPTRPTVRVSGRLGGRVLDLHVALY